MALAGVPASAFADGAPAATVAGNWWYSAYHVADAHAAGWTGKGVKIAVIDGQITPSLQALQGTNLEVDDSPVCSNPGYSVAASTTGAVSSSAQHGSGVTSLLIGNGNGSDEVHGIAPGSEVRFFGYGSPSADGFSCTVSGGSDPYDVALKRALSWGAQIVTTSVSWGSFYNIRTQQDIAKAIASGTILIGSQPDGSSKADALSAPGYCNGVVAVNGVDSSGHLQPDGDDPSKPMVNEDTTVVAAGVNITLPQNESSNLASTTSNGSSLAAPLVAGMLADAWGKFPSASGNQMVQALIRSTGAHVHGVSYDAASGIGYGAASLTGLLESDPLSYPNVNPLLDKSGSPSWSCPTKAMVEAAAAKVSGRTSAASPHASSTPRAAAGDAGRKSDDIPLAAMIVVIAVGLLVVAGVVVLVVALSRRGRSGSGSMTGGA